MSGYVVVHTSPKDADKMQEYGGAAGETVAQHGGEFICRGPATVLAGDSDHKMMVVIKFPTKDAAQKWYDSDEYQKLIPTRLEAMDATFILGGE
ncbi:MAG: DUF1330 domain-containing protein [Gammaproteobacteria bacterium]